MINKSAGTDNAALSVETFSSSYWKKRNAVRKQARDRYGRWVAAGANVQWSANNQNWTGSVEKIINGKAIVKVDNVSNLDGTSPTRTLDVSTLKVTVSKARLDKKGNAMLTGENFKSTVSLPEFNSKLEEDGVVLIKTDDGYTLQAERIKNKDSSATVYQLFAPDGSSMGRYNEDAISMLDKMKTTHKNETAENGQMFANEDPTVVRIARDGKSVLVQNRDESYQVFSSDGEPVSEPSPDFSDFSGHTSWRRVLSEEREAITASLARKDTEDFEVIEPAKSYRVPAAVRAEIQSGLELSANSLSTEDFDKATALSNEESVTLDEVRWIESFFTGIDAAEKLHGGYKGRKWADKILNSKDKPEIVLEDSYSYFALGSKEDSTQVHDLIAVDYANSTVFSWTSDGLRKLDAEISDIEAPQVLPVDIETATKFAQSLFDNEFMDPVDIIDTDPVERNLFELAQAELDFEELDRLTAIIADATGYTPMERSVHAQRQRRGPGGKFQDTGAGDDKKAPEQAPQPQTAGVKAVLPVDLPLVENPGIRIEDWLADAPITAAGEPIEEAPEEVTPTDQGSESMSLYFAIVDEVDKKAVMDVIAITKNDLQMPEGWKRQDKTWVEADDIMAAIQGATPPPVVELAVPDPAKGVIGQIDQFDATKSEEPEPVAASAQKGFALPTGDCAIFTADDLAAVVAEFSNTADSAVKAHIRKRARALNRMDLVPEEWREASAVERGEMLLNQSPLFGDYGEVLVAGGVPGVADTPADFKNVERLKHYWKNGKGAAKIRWGTDGDLTRCHRHLSKYMPGQAWAYCQAIHIEKFGVSNQKRDK